MSHVFVFYFTTPPIPQIMPKHLDETSEDEEDTVIKDPIPNRFQSCTFMTILWTMCFVICMSVVLTHLIISLYQADAQQWFREAISHYFIIPTNNTEDFLDNNLHIFSRWETINKTEWIHVVHYTYEPLLIPKTTPIQFMELGIGVGAWSRIFMREFPNSTCIGVDREQVLLDIAKQVLPMDRVVLVALNMERVPSVYHGALLDYIFLPGTLCYSTTIAEVYWLIKGLAMYDVVKIGGKISATMLIDEDKELGYCQTRIHKQYWHAFRDRFHLITIDDYDINRYSVYLERIA